jgi:serine phosphatase RsbU (regulator of sigma subunit)/ligand-binding sensor domain-containing protein
MQQGTFIKWLIAGLMAFFWSACENNDQHIHWRPPNQDVYTTVYIDTSLGATKNELLNANGEVMRTGLTLPARYEIQKNVLVEEGNLVSLLKQEKSSDNAEMKLKWEDWEVNQNALHKVSTKNGDSLFQLVNSTGMTIKTGEWMDVNMNLLDVQGYKNLTNELRNYSANKNISNISTETGFELNEVWSMTPLQNGSLLLGTRGAGLLEMNGNHFYQWDNKVGFPAGTIRDVIQDKSGRIWMATWGAGICMKQGDQFFQFSEKEGLSCNLVTQLFEDSKERIWFGTEYGGLGIIEDGKWISMCKREGLMEETILDFQEAIDGTMFIATYGLGLCSYDGEEFTYWDKDAGIAESQIWSLLRDHQGDIWIGTWGDHIYRWSNGWMHRAILSNEMTCGPAISMVEDRNEQVWIGTWGKGLFCLAGENARYYDATTGLQNEKVLDVWVDHYDKVWVSTSGGGVHVIQPSPMSWMNVASVLKSNKIRAVASNNKGDIWLASHGSGVVVFKDNEVFSSNPFNGFGSTLYDLICDRNGHFWAATDGSGLCEISENKIRKWIVKNKFMSNVVSAVFEDSQGRIWAAFDNNKVAYFKDDQWTVFDEYSVQTRTAIRSFCEDESGNVYWGVNDFGWIKCSFVNGVPYVKMFTQNEGLPFRSIYDMTWKDGALFLGTELGVAIWKEEKMRLYNRLLGDVIGHVFDFIWWNDRLMMLTEKNLFALEKMDPHINQMDNATMDYELHKSSFVSAQGIAFQPNVQMVIHQDGDLILFVENDIYKMDEEHWEMEYSLSPPLISQVDIIGGFNSDFVSFKDTTKEFPHDVNNFSFHFAAGAESALENSIYTYRLKGFQETWSQPNEENKVDFLGLPPGKYEMQLATVSNKGIASPTFSYFFNITPPWWWTLLAKVIYLLAGVSFIIFIIRWRTHRLQRDQKKLQKEIEKATKEISLQKMQSDIQRERIAESQKLILESIEYAKRIQTAILPPTKLVKSFLPASFIYYQPKDIVAGDFYWMETIQNQNEEWIAFAAADCTGHGVPGALMSVLCHNGLNRSVKEHGLFFPADILNKTREIVINELGNEDNLINDGMDISLCVLRQNKLFWSGANNPLWILRNGEIIEYKGDKQPVGRFHQSYPFTLLELTLEKGDLVFIFTDGYADQFGGPQGKKFKTHQLKQLLISNQHKEMEEIRKVLLRAFEIWKGNLEQVDDVCLIGFRY